MSSSNSNSSRNGFFDYFLTTDKKFSLKGIVALILAAVTFLMSAYFLMTAYYGAPVAVAHRLIFLLFALLLVFFLHPLGRKNWNDDFKWYSVIDFICVLAVLFVGYHYLSDIDGWQLRQFQPSMMDTIASVIIVVLVLEATRRTVGPTMVFVALFFILHTLFANKFPGVLKTAPTTFRRLMDIMISSEGILSEPIQSMASYIIIFLIFGALLEQTGAGKIFIDLAYSIGGRYTAGPAKTAIISSALFGSISGSAVANVVSTGCFTIPLMKDLGYTPEEAGAIESVASTGGNYMPPIMGAVAFLIAQYLGMPYIKIVGYAVIPALLYYIALMTMIHFDGRRRGFKPIDPSKLPSFWSAFKRGWHLILSIVILVYFLVRGFTATKAAFWGTLVLFLLSLTKKETRVSPRNIVKVFEGTAKTSITVGMACACAGIIMGCMFTSGLGVKLSRIIVSLSGGHLVIVLLLTALISLILGCGMPSVGVYLILVTTIVPALTKMGVLPLAAHFFCFYFAVVSNITPPVCVAAFAGAAIAGAQPMKTGFQAFKFGIASYLIPFLFVYNNAILAYGSVIDIIFSSFFAVIGVVCLAGIVARYLFKKNTILETLLLVVATVLTFVPGYLTSVIGLGVFVVAILLQVFNVHSDFILLRRQEETVLA